METILPMALSNNSLNKPQEKRDQAISTVRKSLSRKWDRDFVDAVIKQFHRPRDE